MAESDPRVGADRAAPGRFDPVLRDIVLAHALFAVLCLVVLLAPVELRVGVRLFLLVLVYNAMLPVIGILRRDKGLVSLWLFAAILSVFQVYPDLFLSMQLGVVVYPEDGFPKIGTVSGYMAGLWTMPVFMILFVGERIEKRYALGAAYGAVGLLSLLVFGISEETLWMLPSWYARNVAMIDHVALYILLPEVIFGLSAYAAYKAIEERSHWLKIPAAFLVMLLYLGSTAFFYLLVEKVILG